MRPGLWDTCHCMMVNNICWSCLVSNHKSTTFKQPRRVKFDMQPYFNPTKRYMRNNYGHMTTPLINPSLLFGEYTLLDKGLVTIINILGCLLMICLVWCVIAVSWAYVSTLFKCGAAPGNFVYPILYPCVNNQMRTCWLARIRLLKVWVSAHVFYYWFK